MTSEHLVFMYGTLKKGEPNHERLFDVDRESVQFVARGLTKDRFPLIIGTANNIPFLLLHDGTTGNRILGEIYTVDDATLKHVDEFESYPKIYDRKLINVMVQPNGTEETSQTECLQCYVYGLSRFRTSLLEHPQYNEYRSGGEHNLPFKPLTADSDLKGYGKFLFDE